MATEARSHGPGHGVSADGGMRQHAVQAITGKPLAGEDFGVSELPGRRRIEHPEGEPNGTILSDSERSGPPNIHMGPTSMAATHHSHHGPHHHPHKHHAVAPKGKRPHHV